MKPKEVHKQAINKLLKENFKEKGIMFSDSSLKFTNRLKDGLMDRIGS